jgi:hypothetical protein
LGLAGFNLHAQSAGAGIKLFPTKSSRNTVIRPETHAPVAGLDVLP